MPRSRQVCP